MTLKVRPNAIEQDEGRFKFPQTHLVSGTYVTQGAEPEAEAGLGAYYASSDGKPHFKASDGTDYDLSQGTGGGGGGSGSVVVLDDGSVLGSATRLDFIGDGVSPVLNGETAEITISGGGGGGGDPVSVSTGTVYAEELIQEVELASPTGTISVHGISDEYDEIRVVGSVRSDDAIVVEAVGVRFNGDSGNNYDSSFGAFLADGTSSAGSTIGSGIDGAGISEIRGPEVPGDNAPASHFGSFNFMIPSYAKTDRHKALHGVAYYQNSTDENDLRSQLFGGRWRSTSAITSISLVPLVGTDFKAGSVVRVVGIKEKVVVTEVSGGGGGAPADIYENGGLVLADAEELDFDQSFDVSSSGTRAQVSAHIPVWTQQFIVDQDDSEFFDGFDDEDLSAYTKVDGTGATTGSRTWTEARDLLSLKLDGGDSAEAAHALVRALPGGLSAPCAVESAFYFGTREGQDARFIGGVVLSDGATHGSNAAVGMAWHDDVSEGLYSVDLRHGTFAALGTGVNAMDFHQGPYPWIFLKLIWRTTNEFELEWSIDGVSWLSQVTGVSDTLTPTHFGVWGTTWGYSGPSIGTFQNLRAYNL